VEAKLKDTVALITGSCSGTGAATARRLAAEGAAVALVARRGDRLDDLASAICRDGGTALVVQADVTRQKEAVGAVERTVAQLGRLDIVVNNPRSMLPGSAVDASSADGDQLAALNVQGLLYVTHAALLHLVRAADDSPRGVADLVNISSAADRVARPRSVDDLTRSGVIAFSEAIRREMLGQHVRVSVVESGAVDTDPVCQVREDIPQAARRRTEPIEPMRSGDIADAVAYIVIRDRRVTVNEILICATEQAW